MPRIFDRPMSSGAGWSRPTDWLTMPTLIDGEQKIAMLVAVYEHDSNFSAFTVSGGNYTVDWGDGNAAQNINDGVQAEQNLSWADYDPSTLTSGGYRQALVTITAQSGQTLTLAELSQQHSGAASSYYSQTLEVVAAGSGFGQITFSGEARCSIMEKFEFVGTCNITSMFQMFYYCYSLKTIPLFDTSSVTDMQQMLHNCCSLQSIPLFDTSSVTSMYQMLYGCYSLKTIPLFDTSSVTDMYRMLHGCYSLKTIPLFDTSSVTDMYRMLYGCYSLQSIPLFDTSSVTDMQQMLVACISLGRGAMAGTAVDVSYANCKLSAGEINSIFSNLASGVTSKTVTVSGNWGAATCDPSIATAKGWTVVTA